MIPSRDVEQELRALAAIVVGHADPSRVQRNDRGATIHRARRHGLAPMLEWRRMSPGADRGASDWVVSQETRDAGIRRYLQLRAAFQDVDAALRRRNIPSIWLKGFALAHTVYPAPGLRPMRDLDVLVPAEHREAALACALALGYAHAVQLHRRATQDLWHHYALRGSVALEIHYRLMGPGSQALAPHHLAWFWTQTRQVRGHGLALTILSPEAELLYLSAHAILQHGERDFLLHRFLDIHLLLTHHPRFDWQLTIARAAALGWTSAVSRALEITREYFATPVPDDVVAKLAVRRPVDEAPVSAAGVTRTRLDLMRQVVRGMTAPERKAWIVASLLPSPAFMRARYRVRAAQLPVFYVWRWLSIAGAVLHAIAMHPRVRAKRRRGEEAKRLRNRP